MTPTNAAPPDAGQSRRRVLGWIVRIVACGALIAFAVVTLKDFDLTRLWSILSHANGWLFALTCLAHGGHVMCKAKRWQLLLCDLRTISAWSLARYTLAGLAGTIFLPARLGDALWVWLLARREEIPPTTAVASMVVEKLFEGISLALLVAMVPLFVTLPARYVWLLEALVGGGAVMTVVCVLVARSRRLQTFVSRWPRLASLQPALGSVRSPRRFAANTFWAVLGHLFDVVSLVLLFRATGIEVTWFAAPLVLVSTNAAIFVPLTPGQVGAFELGAMAPLLVLGVPSEQALAFAILLHAMLLPPGIVGVLLALPFISERRREIEAETSASLSEAEIAHEVS